jgi:hypothetical protein
VAQTVCGNCRTPQGPFERRVLKLTNKTQVVIVGCGFRRSQKPTKEERLARTKECNARRAKLDETGELLHG